MPFDLIDTLLDGVADPHRRLGVYVGDLLDFIDNIARPIGCEEGRAHRNGNGEKDGTATAHTNSYSCSSTAMFAGDEASAGRSENRVKPSFAGSSEVLSLCTLSLCTRWVDGCGATTSTFVSGGVGTG